MVKLKPFIKKGKKLKEIYDDINYYRDSLNDEMLPGLEPIGDTGLYQDATNPADPRDCERWTDSPFCGSSPFSKDPISLNPQIVINQCDIGIELTGSLGSIKMPPVHIVYRKPECRNSNFEQEIIGEPESIELENYSIPLKFDVPPCDKGIIGWYCGSFQCHTENVYLTINESGFGNYYKLRKSTFYTKVEVEILEINFPNKIHYLHNENNELAYLHLKYAINTTTEFNQDTPEYGIYNDVLAEGTGSKISGTQIVESWIDPERGYYYLDFSTSGVLNYDAGIAIFPFPGYGTDLINQVSSFGSSGFKNINLEYRGKQYRPYTSVSANFAPIFACETPISTPPPIPKEPCCMGCCPPQDDTLTRLLLKKVALLTEKTEKLSSAVGSDNPPKEPPSSLTQKVNKLSEIIGVDDYPVAVPETLISSVDILGRTIETVPTENIETLPSLILWFIKRFDELMGQWEIPIDIEDADAIQEGNQSKHIRLPNLAEAIAEMTGLLLQTTINSESLINLSTRTLLEAGMNKQQGFKNYYMLDALIDYFGFQTKESSQKLSLTFKPGESDLEKMLKETETEVRVTELDDKNTYKSNMQDLLHAAAIIRAVHWRKFKNDGSVKEQVINLIKGYANTNIKLSGSEKDANDKDDFDKFLDDAETGFTGTTGITDSTNPYGRNYSERPKIRRIGNHTPSKDT